MTGDSRDGNDPCQTYRMPFRVIPVHCGQDFTTVISVFNSLVQFDMGVSRKHGVSSRAITSDVSPTACILFQRLAKDVGYKRMGEARGSGAKLHL